MKQVFNIIVSLIPFFCMAQKQGNIWYFGVQAGLDFNTVPPTPLLNGQTYNFPFGWNEGSSTISDSAGNLLFYTNGMKIWNNQQQVMPNGDSLKGHASSTQSSIIVPQPGSSRYFYVFTTDGLENNFQNGLRYSVVDICLDSGLGDVMAEKNIKLLDTVAEKLICIRHSNGIDYWIITHKFNSDAFYSFRLTGTGIIDTIVSYTITIDNIGWGQAVISNNGLKIAYTAPSGANGFTLLLDFDSSTGIVSNEQILSSGSRVYGLSFSPDNSKLYCSTTGIGEVYQYNLNAGNLAAIIASKTYIVQGGPDGWRQQQLAPDGKIYLSRTGKSYLCRIEFPDSLCPACNYVDSAVYLGGKNASFGLPNFIASYDYSNTIYDCEVGVNEFANTSGAYISNLYPNPSTGKVTLQYELPKGEREGELILYNTQGAKVKRYKVDDTFNDLLLDNTMLPAGTYFYQLQTSKGAVGSKKMVVFK